MSSRRFLLSELPLQGRAILQGSEAHHLRNVLRAEPGRIVELLDGSGRVWRATVGHCSESRVELHNVELIETASAATRLGLIQSLCRPEKLEWILEKCTELGIDDIYLLEASRSVVKIPKDRLEAKMERWRKIILAAVKQSRRSTFPALHPPLPLPMVCRSLSPGVKLLLSEDAGCPSLKGTVRSAKRDRAVFCIGPEGGWTKQEYEELLRWGFQPASLGPQILRTETAALVVTAILKYEWDES